MEGERPRKAGVLIGAVVVVGLLFLLLSRSNSGASGGGGGQTHSYGLSPVRQRAKAILDSLLPAAWPDERFRRIVGASFDPAATPGTTCGALPGRLGVLLGDPTGITRWGVGGARTEGEKRGAWVEAGGGRLPKLGDIYLTAFPPGSSAGSGYAHVGVIESADGSTWTTADAGQGPRLSPRAEYVERTYDPATNLLTRADDPSSARVLVGWIDLDRWPFPEESEGRHELRRLVAEAEIPTYPNGVRSLLPYWPEDPAEARSR